MQIKDVERLTGLTAKSIRFYEAKGLIDVKRNEENSYRSYSENDVERLKLIKLFRYLEFSIEEIKLLLDRDEEQIKEALREKAEVFDKQKNDCRGKQDMCLALAKDYENNPKLIDEYNDTVEFLESDELAEVMTGLETIARPNLTTTIAMTLILSGPILWLFYDIASERYYALMFSTVCALLGAVIITVNWINYAVQYRRHRKRVRENNKKWSWMALVTIGAMVLGFGGLIAFMILLENIMAPKDFLFGQHNGIAEVVMIWLIIIPAVLICLILVAAFKKVAAKELEDMNDIFYIWNHLGKFRPAVIIIWLALLYCCATSVTYVTEDKIIYHSPLSPLGTAYSYEQVTKIDTGFGDKAFAIAEYNRKGNFYYKIEVDGKKIVFHVPSVNNDIQRYADDSYLELEEFDEALMKFGIPKTSSDKNYEKCLMDQRYIDRFLRIINNK